jgi:hypothetical protein
MSGPGSFEALRPMPRTRRTRPPLRRGAGAVDNRGTVLAAVISGRAAAFMRHAPSPATASRLPSVLAARYGRFDSRGRDAFTDRVWSAMRRQFGGHDEKPGAQ